MKQFTQFLLFFALIGLLAACQKDDDSFEPEPFDIAGKPVETTQSGLQYIVVQPGSGSQAMHGLTVSIHYTAYKEDGTYFDSSLEYNYPLSFIVSAHEVLKGLDEGVKLMSQGAKFRLILPPELAYGNESYYGVPANSTITLDVELTEVQSNSNVMNELAQLEQYINDSSVTAEPTVNGMYYIEQQEGDGTEAEYGDVVKVNYTGRLLDGTVFDTNIESVAIEHELYSDSQSYTPMEFELGSRSIIAGFNEGIDLMKQGGTAQLIIPSYLAYGRQAHGSVPAFSTLIFDVELVEVQTN